MDLSGKGCMSLTREKPRVFYVEDDRDIRDLTQYALRQAGFECVGFSDATEFFAACADCLPMGWWHRKTSRILEVKFIVSHSVCSPSYAKNLLR